LIILSKISLEFSCVVTRFFDKFVLTFRRQSLKRLEPIGAFDLIFFMQSRYSLYCSRFLRSRVLEERRYVRTYDA